MTTADSVSSTGALCGQLLVIGFDGAHLPDEVAAWLARGELGGVILFRRNVPTLEATYELTKAVLAAAPLELPPFIGIDQEGGRVTRLPDPALRLPPMRDFGELGDPSLVRRAGCGLGIQLAALGFNLNFAPVLDVDSNPDNPIIGNRAFAPDPEAVIRLGCELIAGLQERGVMACAKHFPGHGDTSKDSHVELPRVARSLHELECTELPPFKSAAVAGVASMMTAHVIYDALDPGVPATLSRRICTELLRNQFGFEGVLFSDDLEMRAVSDAPIEQTAVTAIEAGCDALLICSDLSLAERAHSALIQRADADPVFRQRCEQALTRVLAARRHYPPRPAFTLIDAHTQAQNADLAAVLEDVQRRS